MFLKILDTGLQVFQYPPEESQVNDPEKQDESETNSSTPVGVTVALPESVVFLEEPQVARWDLEGMYHSGRVRVVRKLQDICI